MTLEEARTWIEKESRKLHNIYNISEYCILRNEADDTYKAECVLSKEIIEEWEEYGYEISEIVQVQKPVLNDFKVHLFNGCSIRKETIEKVLEKGKYQNRRFAYEMYENRDGSLGIQRTGIVKRFSGTWHVTEGVCLLYWK